MFVSVLAANFAIQKSRVYIVNGIRIQRHLNWPNQICLPKFNRQFQNLFPSFFVSKTEGSYSILMNDDHIRWSRNCSNFSMKLKDFDVRWIVRKSPIATIDLSSWFEKFSIQLVRTYSEAVTVWETVVAASGWSFLGGHLPGWKKAEKF